MKAPRGAAAAEDAGLSSARRRQRLATTLAGSVLLLAIVLAATAWRVRNDRDFLRGVYDQRLVNLANAVAEGTRLSVEPLAESLDAVIPQARRALDPGMPGAHAELVASLRLLRKSTPEGLEFFVLSPSGRLVADSSDEPVGKPDLSDSESFAWHRDHPGASTHLSQPLVGFIGSGAGSTIIRVSRSWRTTSGQLGGVVVATYSPDRLRAFHARLRVGKTGVITVFRDDGTLLSRQPVASGTVGRRYADSPLFRGAMQDAREGLFDAFFSADGIERRVGFRRLDDLPLVVTVALAESDILAAWQRRTAIDLVLTGLLLAIAAVTAAYAYRSARDSEDRALGTARRYALLAAGSADIARSADIGELVGRVTRLSRRLVPAHQALTSFTQGADFSQQIRAVELSDKYARFRGYNLMPDGSGIYRLVCEQNRAFRLSQAELEAHPAWRGFGHAAADHPPLRGWLAAPLVGRDGANLGLIQLSDREIGEFDETDEAILVQLGLLAAATLENFRLVQAAREAEASAIRARQELESILGSISDGFFALDDAWRFSYVNAEGERMLRRRRDELLGRSLWEVYPEADGPELGDRLRAARASERPVRFELRHAPHDLCAEIRAFPHERGLSIYVLDITQRVKAERVAAHHRAALEESLARYERLKENSLDVICTLDAQGRFTEVSARARQTWGYEPAEMIGRTYESFVHPDDREPTRAATAKVLAGEAVEGVENRYVRKDGSIARMQWNAVWSEADRAVFAVARDITERAELEERVRQAQKMEAIGQLTGGVAHDFNNLLTVVLGNADELAVALSANQRLRSLAEMTRTAAERGAELTSRLLSFARRQPLNPSPLDVSERLADLEGLLRRLLGERIDIVLVHGTGLWPASVDGAQLDVAIVNLAVNARDAMPGGGRLTIETSNASLDEAYAAANRDVVPGQYVCIAISDCGSGMAPEVLARAFEPFFTTKPIGQGSGLGLSMVYGFARQSGGHVKIYSEPGEGTTVRLYLPRAEGGGAYVQAAGDSAVPRGSGAVCLVEDDSLVREFTRSVLVDLGYTVHDFGNGDDALAAIDAGLPVDLLLTDIVLPGRLNGNQLGQAARSRRPDLKVLYVSGYSENAIIHHGRLDPGVELLSKPFRRVDLAMRLQKLLG